MLSATSKCRGASLMACVVDLPSFLFLGIKIGTEMMHLISMEIISGLYLQARPVIIRVFFMQQ